LGGLFTAAGWREFLCFVELSYDIFVEMLDSIACLPVVHGPQPGRLRTAVGGE
jgi:hypothetical protein